MNQVREYRNPLLIAGGGLVVAIILWLALISPQNSKLSSLQTQSTQLQTQESTLQAKLTALESEGQKLSTNCADLVRISTQIPSVQTPTDVDAEESSFESQFNNLAGTSGVTLAQFSGFTPAGVTATGAVAVPATATATGATTPGDVTAVPTTLTVQGTYGQIMSFVNGLDTFPRLFVIQRFVLSYGQAVSAGSGSAAAAAIPTTPASSASTSSAIGTPLWVGGTPTSASASPYNLAITGSIYYTSTPNALSACTKATAAQTTTR
jgi:Tfp pilus assembly protein PilO